MGGHDDCWVFLLNNLLYAQFLANHPFLVLSGIFTSNIIILLVIICTDNIPTFDDPQAGFVPRGTRINHKSLAWRNLVTQLEQPRTPPQQYPAGDREIIPEYNHTDNGGLPTVTGEDDSEEGRTTIAFDQEPNTMGFFCAEPARNHGRLIFCHPFRHGIMELPTLHGICAIDRTIRRLPEFRKIAEKDGRRRYCPSWTVANVIAALSRRKSCRHLNETDTKAFQALAKACLPYYRSGQLHKHCGSNDINRCLDVPEVCVKDNLLYNVFYYISDKESLENNYTNAKCTLGILPTWSGPISLPLYNEMRRANLTENGVELVGIEMGLKDHLFDVYLIHDTIYMGAALGAVVGALWIYSGSLFVTLMNILAVFFPLVLSYFFYVFIFRLRFFPFMNLLTCVIMIAVGADALVIFSKLWHTAKTEKNDGKFEKVIFATIRHAFKAILVSSLTASGALFGDTVNSIIAIRSFSIFAGFAVLIHYLFMVTWLPATFVIAEKWGSAFYGCRYVLLQKSCDSKASSCHFLYECQCLTYPFRQFSDYFRVFFEKLLPCIVIRLKWVWIILFLFLTTTACVAVFYNPKLQLPTSRLFHLWDRRHPFEQYQLLKNRFSFENATSDTNIRMPLRFVWGILPISNARALDPSHSGNLAYDEKFDLSAQESQMWMMEFCRDLSRQSFFYDSPGLQTTNCFVLSLKEWIFSQGCHASGLCCKNLTFPLEPPIFLHCSREFFHLLQTVIPWTKHAGPKYDVHGRLQSVIIEYESSHYFSYSFAKTQEFYVTVQTWFETKLYNAPAGLQSGWFISHLDFLDVQESLLNGTMTSLIISLIIALVVLFITTRNICISIFAVITIAGIIIVTTAILVLIGWELNVFESTVIGLGVGLSVDFTLHYAVSYCSSDAEERELKTNYMIVEMSSPVAMSALTTFLVGLLMLPSEILMYQQIGIFIIVVISISLLFATVFYPAMLAALGPQGDFLQFHYPFCRLICCRSDPSKLVEKSMHSSVDFDTTMTGTLDRDNYYPKTSRPEQNLVAPNLISVTVTPEPVPKNVTLQVDLVDALEETDSVGELGSMPTSRGASRGSSLVRKHSGKGLFSWDYVMQKLPLSRHFSVAGSSVIYIDSDVRSVTSDVPAVLPNAHPEIPEVWVKRTE